jgi:hypothetical protein
MFSCHKSEMNNMRADWGERGGWGVLNPGGGGVGGAGGERCF